MASYVNESFTLLKFGQISICQNQKLQIPNFIVYKTPDVQSTKIKCGSSVTEICHEIAWQPFKPRFVFLSSFSLLYFVNQVVAQMPWVVPLHTWPYVPFVFMYIFNLFIFLFFSTSFSDKKHLHYHIIYVSKTILWNPEGFQRSFWMTSTVVLHAYRTILSKVTSLSFN